jgi:group I intron endonuclease
VGSALNGYKRKHLHFKSLKNNIHHNLKLQHHYNKYGSEDLVFEVLEKDISPPNIILREQYYLDSYKPFFNICRTAGSCLGRKHSSETKTKISNSLKGRLI